MTVTRQRWRVKFVLIILMVHFFFVCFATEVICKIKKKLISVPIVFCHLTQSIPTGDVGWAKRYHRLCWEDVSCRKVRQPIRQPLHRIVSVARMLPDWTKLERVHQNVWIDLVDRYDLDKDGGLGFTNGEFTLLISDLTRRGARCQKYFGRNICKHWPHNLV